MLEIYKQQIYKYGKKEKCFSCYYNYKELKEMYFFIYFNRKIPNKKIEKLALLYLLDDAEKYNGWYIKRNNKYKYKNGIRFYR